MKDYYTILGVSENATQKEINKAYNNFVKKLHPDRTKSESDRKLFLEIQEAYETLSHKEKRAHYDNSKRNPFFDQNASYNSQSQQGNDFSFGSPFQQNSTQETFQDFENIFSGFFNNDFFFSSSSFPNEAFSYKNINTSVRLDFFKGSIGCTETLKYKYECMCSCLQNTNRSTSKYCGNCKKGWITKDKSLSITFPASLKEEQVFNLVGHGNDYGNNRKSDLRVTVFTTMSYEDWHRVDKCIYKDIFLSNDMIKGGTIQVENIYNKSIDVVIPEHIQSGDKIILENEGVKTDNGCGDFVLSLLLYIPKNKNDSHREKKIFRQKQKK